ncbi:MAG: VRR-NUC domain-containing protein [Bosea sp. (in: a-proteobacteria)]
MPTEHVEALRLMELVRLHEPQHPALRWLFAVPNGGKRSKITAVKLKAEGVKPGVPDYLMPIPATHGGFVGLAIELKRTRGGATSQEQIEWLEMLRVCGWRVAVCKGHRQAWSVICEYLAIVNCLERNTCT